jgi:hypothetical protein
MKQIIVEKSYSETNLFARSPTLQTVLMVEKFIKDNSGSYKKSGLFKELPKQVMWQTFQVIIEYLKDNNKIGFDRDGFCVWVWNPELYNSLKHRIVVA